MRNCRSSFSHLNLSMVFYYIILSKNSSKPHAVPDCLFFGGGGGGVVGTGGVMMQILTLVLTLPHPCSFIQLILMDTFKKKTC